MTEGLANTDTPAGVLAFARSQRATADLAEARQLQAAVAWAAMHSVDSLADAAHLWERSYGDTGVPVAGPGAPLVAEFSVAEFAAALGLSTDAGRGYLGEAVELRYRLPRLWARVDGRGPGGVEGPPHRPRHHRPDPGGGGVRGRATSRTWRTGSGRCQLDRLVEEAIARFMPEEVERRRRAAADGRRFDVDTRDPSLAGTAQVWGELDLADALDLDAAVAAGAEQLKALGSTESLDVRRAAAVGELARRQQTLDLTTHRRRDGTTDARHGGAGRGRSCCTSTCPTPPSPTAGWGSWGGWRTPGR